MFSSFSHLFALAETNDVDDANAAAAVNDDDVSAWDLPKRKRLINKRNSYTRQKLLASLQASKLASKRANGQLPSVI